MTKLLLVSILIGYSIPIEAAKRQINNTKNHHFHRVKNPLQHKASSPQEAISTIDQDQTFKRRDIDPSTKEKLSFFANFINNFFSIFQDRENPEHVGKCLEGIASNLINVGVSAAKDLQTRTNRFTITPEESESVSKKILAIFEELFAKTLDE